MELTGNFQKVCEVSYKVTQNITGYTSLYMKYGSRNEGTLTDTIYWEIRQRAVNPYGTYFAWEWTGELPYSIKHGSTVKASGNMTQTPGIYSNGNEVVRKTGSYTQTHNADGTYSTTVNFSAPVYTENKTATGAMSLPTIITNPTLSVGTITDMTTSGSTVSYTLGKCNGRSVNFQYSLNGTSNWQTLATKSLDGTYSVTLGSLLKTYTSVPKFNVYFRAITGNYSSSVITKEITVSSTIKPNVTKVEIQAINSISGLGSLFVKTLTRPRIKTTATAYTNGGATLSRYDLTALGGYDSNITQNNIGSSYDYTTEFQQASNSVKATVKVTDTRGANTSLQSATAIKVIDYFNPTLSNLKVQRCNQDGTLNNNGTYCKLTVSYNVAPINDGSSNHNTKTLSYSLNNSSWTALTASGFSGTFSGVIPNQTFSTNSSYPIYVRLEDVAHSGNNGVKLNITLPTAYVLISKKSGGKGIAFGKIAETNDMFEVDLYTKFLKNIYMPRGLVVRDDQDKNIFAVNTNNNVILNAAGAGLYLAYRNSTSVNILDSKVVIDSNGNITAPQIKNANGGSWYSGRDNAVARCTKSNDDRWHPVISSKTKNGSWEVGNLGSNDVLYFSYITDTNYNASTNTRTYGISLPTKDGTLAVTSDIPTNTNQLTNGSGFINTSNSSKASDGYFKLSNGLIVQWGSATCGTQKTMPTSFSSTSSFSLVACEQQQGASATVNVVINAKNKFTPYAKYGSNYYTDTVRWIAIGY